MRLLAGGGGRVTQHRQSWIVAEACALEAPGLERTARSDLHCLLLCSQGSQALLATGVSYPWSVVSVSPLARAYDNGIVPNTLYCVIVQFQGA